MARWRIYVCEVTGIRNDHVPQEEPLLFEPDIEAGDSAMRSRSPGPRCVVVGVGNQFMRDDGVGIAVASELKKRSLGDDVLILQRHMLDISVLLLAENASKLIVVDALKAGTAPGTVVRFTATRKGSPGLKVPLTHDMRLADLIALAKKSKISLCPTVVIGVEPADCTIGEGMTPMVREAVPAAVKAVLAELRKPRRV
jgi:hydrogenase maturation protease